MQGLSSVSKFILREVPMPKKVRQKNVSRKIKQQLLKPNPALKLLEVLVGDWEIEISNAPFLPSPSETVHGHVTFEWFENGAFLVMREGDMPQGATVGIWVIGRDDSVPDYSILHYDSRGISRRYEMSFNDGVWKIWRESPGFWQRFEGKISDNSNTMTASWEKSTDGKNWEHDFDMTSTKI
jgi:hypothetical protein